MGRVRDLLPPGVARAMRVDRTTALGNPYRMEREGERGAACDAYAVLVELNHNLPVWFVKILDHFRKTLC